MQRGLQPAGYIVHGGPSMLPSPRDPRQGTPVPNSLLEKKMTEDILNDDQLDAVAGGTTVVVATKVANTAYAATVRSDKASITPAPVVRTIDRTASNAGLASLRSVSQP